MNNNKNSLKTCKQTGKDNLINVVYWEKFIITDPLKDRSTAPSPYTAYAKEKVTLLNNFMNTEVSSSVKSETKEHADNKISAAQTRVSQQQGHNNAVEVLEVEDIENENNVKSLPPTSTFRH
jgi:hypothetical protein